MDYTNEASPEPNEPFDGSPAPGFPEPMAWCPPPLPPPYYPDRRSWWERVFGRSILRALVGTFFGDKNNAASVIAIILVVTLCYVVAVKEKYDYANGLLNIVFVVIGYYFGSKREVDKGGDT